MKPLLLRLFSLVTVMCICGMMLALWVGKFSQIPNNEIVFTATIDSSDMHIYLMDIARQFSYDMSRKEMVGYEPAWSPDGQQIAYVGAGKKGFTIYKHDLEAKLTHELIHDAGGVYSPAWSPDGQQMSYVSLTSDRFSRVMLTDLQTGSTRQITNTLYHNDNHPDWSPDNRFIAFVTNEDAFGKSNISILDLQSGNAHPMFSSLENQYFPRWSPDSRYVAFISQGYKIGIALWDVEQSQYHLLYNRLIQKGAVDWSPDGRYIIYADFISYKHSGIFRLDMAECLDTTIDCQPQLLTPTNGLYSNPRFRPRQP